MGFHKLYVEYIYNRAHGNPMCEPTPGNVELGQGHLRPGVQVIEKRLETSSSKYHPPKLNCLPLKNDATGTFPIGSRYSNFSGVNSLLNFGRVSTCFRKWHQVCNRNCLMFFFPIFFLVFIKRFDLEGLKCFLLTFNLFDLLSWW